MDDIIGMIFLIITIIVSLPIVGIIMILWFADWRQERRFKKFQKGELSKEDWKNGEKEDYEHWLGC